MALTLQQAVGLAGSSGSSVGNSFTPKVVGSIIFAWFVVQNNGGATLTGVTGSINGAYTQVGSPLATSGNFFNAWLFQVTNTTTSLETVTAHFTGTAGQTALCVMEWTGQNASPIGNTAQGTLASGTAVDINTSTTLAANNTDVVLLFGGNYFAPTWAVGATNPSGMALDAQKNQGTGNSNAWCGHALLSAGYTGKVGLNPGSGVSDTGGVIGVQLIAGGAPALFLGWLPPLEQPIPQRREVVEYH